MDRVVRGLSGLSMERVKTGVVGLDTMLNGGFLPCRPYVVSGPTGSGKTVLCAQFLLEGLQQQEACLMVTLDEPPIEVKSNMATFGWNLDRLKILDATPDVRAHKRAGAVIDVGTSLDVRDMEDVTDIRQSSQVRALEVTVHSVQKMIKQEFFHHLDRTKQRYRRIVIDSMTALKMFSMQGQDSRILIQSFLRFLAELEATTLIVSERLDRKALETEFFLARGEVRLHKWIDGSMIRHAISIEKFRGSAFDDKMHPLTIGSQGMGVLLDAPSQIRGTSPETKPGESLLEARIIDEVSNVIEAVMRQIEEAHRRQVPVRDIEVALSRAMLAFQRRNYQKALKIALACDAQMRERIAQAPPPPPIGMPPRPPQVIR
jgi:KaiC/GvpD/RAD55 family RecA-like ATPase